MPPLMQALEKLQNFAAPPDLDVAAKHLVAAQGELQRVVSLNLLLSSSLAHIGCVDDCLSSQQPPHWRDRDSSH